MPLLFWCAATSLSLVPQKVPLTLTKDAPIPMQVICQPDTRPSVHPDSHSHTIHENVQSNFSRPSELGRKDWKIILQRTVKSLISGPTTLEVS